MFVSTLNVYEYVPFHLKLGTRQVDIYTYWQASKDIVDCDCDRMSSFSMVFFNIHVYLHEKSAHVI